MSTRRAATALCALAATVVSLAPNDADAYCRMTTSRRAPTPDMQCVREGIPLKWPRRCMSYALQQDGSISPGLGIESVSSIVGASFATWLAVRCNGQTPGLDVRELQARAVCDKAEYDREGPNSNTVIFLSGTEWGVREYDNSAYALTTVWHNTRTGDIFDVDMEINEGRGPYGVCPDVTGCSDGVVDLQNVVTHEVGHFFAMAHTPDSAIATMYAVSPPGEVSKRILRDDDVAGFCTIYPPGTLPMACDFTPQGGLSLVCKPPDDGSCNCSIPGSTRSASRVAQGPSNSLHTEPDGRLPAGPIFGAFASLAAIGLVLRRRRR